jgi:hypothetical protein
MVHAAALPSGTLTLLFTFIVFIDNVVEYRGEYRFVSGTCCSLHSAAVDNEGVYGMS